MAPPAKHASIFIDPLSLRVGDVIEFFDTTLSQEFSGRYKIAGAWDKIRPDANGKQCEDRYLDCDRLYTLVRENGNDPVIYKTNHFAPDTLQRVKSKSSGARNNSNSGEC